jgi:hypothetical protein
MLKRFWFEFERFAHPTALNIGCGVTAYDYDDAVSILHERVFAGQPFPKVLRFVPDVNVQDLDKDHVLPNMGIVAQRGVWFPLGF